MQNIIIIRFVTSLFLSFFIGNLFAGNDSGSISGRIILAESGEGAPFVNVVIADSHWGCLTNDEGHFSLDQIPAGTHQLVVSGMGYLAQTMVVELRPAQQLNLSVMLHPDPVHLAEVTITSSPTSSGFRYQADMGFFGESLQRRSEASFGEMLDGEPGVAMRSMGSAPARPVIRGMDGDRILILEHGERMGDVSQSGSGHSLTMDPLTANRVEVVKGPASLLYGSSALGGVINLMTADIPEDWDKGTSGVASIQAASVNKMGAGFGRLTQGWDDYAITGRFALRKADDIMTPGGVMPGTYMDHLDAAMGFGLQRERTQGGIGFSLNQQAYGLPEELDDPDESVEVRQNRYGMQGRFLFERDENIDKIQWRFQGTHLRQEEIAMIREDGLFSEALELFHDKWAFSSTLTLQHMPRGIFDRGAVGFNFYGHNLEIGGDETYTPGERRANLGAFTYQEIPFSPRLRLQAGLRVDVQYTEALPNKVFYNVNQSRSAVNLTGSVGLNYRVGERWEMGGQVARSHRNPMVEELFANGPHLCSGVYELGSTDLKDEIGHGMDFFIERKGSRLHLELAAYYNRFSNFIIFQPTGAIDEASMLPVFEYTGDGARFFGGELVSSMQWTSVLQSVVTLDYVNARRTSNQREYLPFIPPLRLTTTIEYQSDQFWANVNTRFVTRQEKVAPEEDITAGYVLLGLSAGYRMDHGGRHAMILRVENLLNKEYRDHLSRVEDRQFPMPGRNINLSYRFYF